MGGFLIFGDHTYHRFSTKYFQCDVSCHRSKGSIMWICPASIHTGWGLACLSSSFGGYHYYQYIILSLSTFHIITINISYYQYIIFSISYYHVISINIIILSIPIYHIINILIYQYHHIIKKAKYVYFLYIGKGSKQ